MVTVYRDTPKKGETDAEWCWYRSSDNGHIVAAGVGYETEQEARKAAVGSGPATRG